MKIEHATRRQDAIAFSDLETGDVFVLDGDGDDDDAIVWMRIENASYENDAVDLSEGVVGLFADDDRVRRVDAKVVVE